MPAEQYMVYCTCPDETVAREVAGNLVERRLAACVNIVPGLTSVFFWEGEAQAEPEVLLLIKTSASAYPALEQAILELHPYELPEIVGVPLEKGLPGFLHWIHMETRGEAQDDDTEEDASDPHTR
ncbi:periplasmic divalent cation tolerance protein [Alkalispirillum mobile]|uniref:Periplasmic divalent cation tolerance protein n=1 Tax=Alkalispirillum mobile TaxID=85925 RepID=A0A498BUA2_9GAMM|nr:divalent-cation tolerance protein CutA [Alkalispirillum mobile]RLK46529.1 periplasmic divalent cation tolerance protein [Alkalispirillum mobile]